MLSHFVHPLDTPSLPRYKRNEKSFIVALNLLNRFRSILFDPLFVEFTHIHKIIANKYIPSKCDVHLCIEWNTFHSKFKINSKSIDRESFFHLSFPRPTIQFHPKIESLLCFHHHPISSEIFRNWFFFKLENLNKSKTARISIESIFFKLPNWFH